MTIDVARSGLAAARAGGDEAAVADALGALASALVSAGDLASARDALDEAAALHAKGDRQDGERHCCQFAATLSRLLGDADGALARAARAAHLSARGTRDAISAHAELAETALASGDLEAAAAAFRDALRHADAAAISPSDRAALLRKQAAALEADDRTTQAVEALDEAYVLLIRAQDPIMALRVRIEAVTALQNAGRNYEADIRRAEVFEEARRLNDQHALADLELLESAATLDGSDAEGALAAALRAREHALAAHAAVTYTAATIAIAELHEDAGDRVASYAALAGGYDVLSDMLSPGAASETLGARIADCRDRWGAETFRDVKSAYEAQRDAGG
jgi:hypothetical protein